MCLTNTRKTGRLSSLTKRSDCCSFSAETLPAAVSRRASAAFGRCFACRRVCGNVFRFSGITAMRGKMPSEPDSGFRRHCRGCGGRVYQIPSKVFVQRQNFRLSVGLKVSVPPCCPSVAMSSRLILPVRTAS